MLFTIGSMAVYDYVQEKKTNREQQIQISANKENIAADACHSSLSKAMAHPPELS